MSRETEQIKHMIRNPKAVMDYHMKGKLPNAIRPTSPLISYLESIAPRDRQNIKNVRLSPKLGYQSGAQFRNAEQMLRYLKPRDYVVGNWPAESVRIKAFNTKITEEIFNQAQKN